MSGLLVHRIGDVRESMKVAMNYKSLTSTDHGRQTPFPFEDIVETRSTKYQLLSLCGISVLYLALTIQLARAKLLWTDEFFTLYLSRLGMGELWRALLTGGDQHPPTFYVVHHVILGVFGEHPWALRLPAILGFLLMMLCIYRFVAKRTSPVYGLVAMALPLVTGAHEYSYEARGYSLLLGFAAFAVVCWQQAGEDRLRTAAVFGLAAGLTAAVASHYYSILILPAIAAAELVRSWRRKSGDAMVWVALCTPIIAFMAFSPLLRSSSGFALTFWAKVSPLEIHAFYKNLLGPALTCLFLGLAVPGLYVAVCDQYEKPSSKSRASVPIDEIVLAVVLAGAPIIAYVFGEVVTGVFAWRYAIGGVIGIAILLSFCCFRLFRGSAIAGSMFVLIAVAYFVIASQVKMRALTLERTALGKLITVLASTVTDSEPLVIGDSKVFYVLSYYSPPAMKERCIYLVDPQRSVKYLHHDTVERSLWALEPWFKLNIKPYAPYVKSHREFMVWSGVDPKWSWLLSALIDDGEKPTVVRRIRGGMLFLVRSADAGIDP